MRKGRWILWGAAVAVLAVVAVLSLRGWSVINSYFGSQYDGHSAGYWVEHLDDPDLAVRADAIHNVERMGADAKDAVPKLAKIMLGDGSRDEKINAAKALGTLVPESRTAVPELARSLKQKDFFVRAYAALALSNLGAYSKKHSEEPSTKAAVPALLEALQDKSNRTNLKTFSTTVTGMVALALARATLGTEEGVPPLMEALKIYRFDNRDIKVRNTNVGRSNKENLKLDSEATEVAKFIETKISFAQALGELGPAAKPALPLLEELLKVEIDRAKSLNEQASDFKAAAEEAIGKIEGKTPSAPAADSAKSEDNAYKKRMERGRSGK